ncbi:MAG: hypothetical protein NVSMB2_00290 [Chloroflexota bacterium]
MIGMQVVLTGAQWVVRVCGVLLLILGLLIWVEGMGNLISMHTWLGLLLVLGMWVLAAVGARLGVPMGLAAGLAVMGLLVAALGMTQTRLLPGSTHWVIQIVHLLLGMAAVGLSESLGGRLRRMQDVTA